MVPHSARLCEPFREVLRMYARSPGCDDHGTSTKEASHDCQGGLQPASLADGAADRGAAGRADLRDHVLAGGDWIPGAIIVVASLIGLARQIPIIARALQRGRALATARQADGLTARLTLTAVTGPLRAARGGGRRRSPNRQRRRQGIPIRTASTWAGSIASRLPRPREHGEQGEGRAVPRLESRGQQAAQVVRHLQPAEPAPGIAASSPRTPSVPARTTGWRCSTHPPRGAGCGTASGEIGSPASYLPRHRRLRAFPRNGRSHLYHIRPGQHLHRPHPRSASGPRGPSNSTPTATARGPQHGLWLPGLGLHVLRHRVRPDRHQPQEHRPCRLRAPRSTTTSPTRRELHGRLDRQRCPTT